MKNIFQKTITAASASFFLFSCKPHVDVPAASKGSIDVSRYVAIGNSMTAGYADNALYYDGQVSSYPNLLAKQFQLIGNKGFSQPLVDEFSVGIGSTQTSKLVLAPKADCQGLVSLSAVPVSAAGDLSVFARTAGSVGPYSNLGVPGAKATTVPFAGYGNPANGAGLYNPFFTRMAADPSSSSILSDALSQDPTFFSVSLGNDDAMSYAISGGVGDVITPSSGQPGIGFNETMDLIIDQLTLNNAKGVIANIPQISAIPYFNTIPYNGLALDADHAEAMNAAYAPAGISFHAGANGFVIADANAPAGMRLIEQGEMILLSTPQDSIKCAGWGSLKPIPEQYVLTAGELANVSAAITDYNEKLKAIADAKGLAFVDVDALVHRLQSGILYNGAAMNASYVSGGIFSLDGIHFTPKGNAMLANEFIKAINAKYGATIPQLDITMYKGIAFP